MELLAFSVGIGLVIGVFCSEMLGMASSGLIVPGYIAIYLMKPMHLVATMVVAFATYGLVRVIGSFVIIHGRRRSVMMILVGYILGMLVNQFSGTWLPATPDVAVIGFIIPGIIAMWMDRQGVPQTLNALFVVSVAVRLVLILAGVELTDS
jgi:poly-gamma-glutamate biosynthesis protein PgsC/CapC